MLHLITHKTKTTILGMAANKMGNKGCCTSLQNNNILIFGGLKIKLENEEPNN